jgi:hypothetical protein
MQAARFSSAVIQTFSDDFKNLTQKAAAPGNFIQKRAALAQAESHA